MARIRTIKPEFFTSADIVELTPLARLFYVSLWCEADREGRLEWKPKTLKLRYLPGDECDVEQLAGELTGAGLVVLYEVHDKQYAEIPSFTKHQVINNRESPSALPPRATDASGTREPRVKAEGKEGRKGREGDSAEPHSDSPPSSGEQAAPAEPIPSEPAVVAIPLNDGSEYGVGPAMVTEWEAAYPAVDVVQQLREMRTWSLANRTQRKTRRGVQSFIVRWLSKEQDSGGSRQKPKQAEMGAFV